MAMLARKLSLPQVSTTMIAVYILYVNTSRLKVLLEKNFTKPSYIILYALQQISPMYAINNLYQ